MMEITAEIRALIDKAAAGVELAGDEYIDPADGLIHCKKCGGQRQTVVPCFGKPGYFMPRCICQCQREAEEQRKAAEERQRRMERIKRRKAQGLQDRYLYDYTFANDNGQNPLMDKARAYVENWKEAYKNNTGLLLFGDVGTGKSFFAGCIANALLDRDVPVLMTNFPTILNRLTGMFSEDRADFIASFDEYDLLIIDDLGVERSTEYAMEQKLQGHWIIEMSEMLATSSAKSIEEIRSFISRQKETYRTPYEAQPKDRLRQCVFGGSSNTLDFLPLDRAGNRRFLPIMIYPENAEVHILEDEDASRAYLLQVWAEAMTIYRSDHYSMKFSKSIQRQLVEVQKDFMPEDTEAGQIQGFLEHYTGSMVCSKQLFKEALGHTYDEPKRWQLHNINEIMNTVVTGWKPFSNPRMFAGYGRQKGWERDVSGNEDGFVEMTEEECRQLELPKEWIA